MQPLIDSAGHRLTVSLPSQPILVDGDVARLTQVFGNILHNAAKYAGRNGVIWVGAHCENGRVAVSIRDNGPGIPQHMLVQIFEMFRQVDEQSKRAPSAAWASACRSSSSSSSCTAAPSRRTSAGPGLGSEFIVTLPAIADGASQALVSHSLHHVAGVPRHRILVVDDVSASATTLAMMLRGLGQDVKTANDGPSGLVQADEFKPQVAFLDIAMPGMDGYEVAPPVAGPR